MKICQQGMIYRKMAHLPPLIVMTKQNIQYFAMKIIENNRKISKRRFLIKFY